MRRRAFRDRFREKSAQQRTIHLHHVGKIEIEYVADRLLHHGMVTANVENAVAAQEIEIWLVIHIVEIGAFGPGIDLVEADDALGCNQGAVQMPLVQFVIFAQPRRNDLFQIKSHAPTFCDLRSKRKLVDRPACSRKLSELRRAMLKLLGFADIILTSSKGLLDPPTVPNRDKLRVRLS